MKFRIIVTALLLFTGTQTSLAQNDAVQPRKTAEQRTDQVVEEMTTELSLTPEQQTQIRDIVLLREKKRDAGRLTEDEKKEFKKQIHAVLTPEQQKKQKELKQENKGKKKGQKADTTPKKSQEQPITE